MTEKTRVAILGASGYTGAELVRFLVHHPKVSIVALSANRKAGQTMGSVFPHLAPYDLPVLTSIDEVDFAGVDFVFCALPHGTTQALVRSLLEGPHGGRLRIADLSADFRLTDAADYETWYGHPHQAPELQEEAVYGLVERNRQAIRSARLVAVPGCYPTSALLPLWPLLEAGVVEADPLIVDSKSGASGGGRDPKEGMLHCEVSEGVYAYGIGSHRHGPEIDQELSLAAGRPVRVTFTPHLMPMNRGILSTIYARLKDGVCMADARKVLEDRYRDEAFVHVVPEGTLVHTRHVRGSNLALIGLHEDRTPGRVIVTCVEDNLVKGASGQAIQNMNVMLGFEETTGIAQAPMFP
ncbi:N-acetyl-gamma-glutamyl-phosphate reductase [Phaeovibrio sulfidiphilus]|uniref:N-acetyl-gamma-glutamyl-phosphate reductase n=1 Tax=Phaeovibrio sulfidiphilus TaxID=1220600 RepID=A0A8J6YNK0_9PROT|nr:N-acetyl-gamma-glutamyl-phosphate reductase [Phaeovibrio sulfidiphilus]MBE1236217.1 N-acetyl-gamma-glutamyl-phosphate reductase [Phaeovibrio sulfidiphilus]